MHCVVTAGPTYENLDKVRRLTNFSSGRLGTELAAFLARRKHQVTLFIGEQATYNGKRRADRIETFTTTESLRQLLESMTSEPVDAVFHAAAVSDFSFGKTWLKSPHGELTEIKAGKIPTRQGTLMAELVPTPKVIAGLRNWFPKAKLVGWKYEVDGDRAAALAAAEKQIREYLTDACIANGPAYGEGFGLVESDGNRTDLADTKALFAHLAKLIRT